MLDLLYLIAQLLLWLFVFVGIAVVCAAVILVPPAYAFRWLYRRARAHFAEPVPSPTKEAV